jgi:hypothetical protein
MNKRGFSLKKETAANRRQKSFLRCLDYALHDDRWRAFISAQVRQHELPVIQLEGRGRQKMAEPHTRRDRR